MEDQLYFRQLLSGRDFARGDQIASQMANFSYLVGDSATRECLVVDPAYDVDGLIAAAEEDGYSITGALVTHYHADHCGGNMMGFNIAGASELVEKTPVPIHVQTDEIPWVQKVTELGTNDLVGHSSGDKVTVGSIDVELIHTPGHTPGSQCFLVHDHLIAGDTLFLDGCGRTDLPGGNPEDLYVSLTQRLAKVSDNAVLYPGHQYSPDPSASMGDTRQNNVVFRPKTAEQWMMMFGGA